MDFYDILARIPKDKSLAIQIAQKAGLDIPEFETQLQTFNSLDSYSRERQPSFAKLAQLANNFVQWHTVYGISFCRDLSLFSSLFLDARDLAIKKMTQLAQTFEQWAHLLDVFRDSKDKEMALGKMLELAQTFEQTAQVWKHTYNFKAIRKAALKKMAKLAKTFEHWHKLYHLVDDDKLKELALKNMGSAQNFDQWFEIWEHDYSCANPESLLLDLALEKILELAQTFEHWRQIWHGASHRNLIIEQEKLETLALEKMIELL